MQQSYSIFWGTCRAGSNNILVSVTKTTSRSKPNNLEEMWHCLTVGNCSGCYCIGKLGMHFGSYETGTYKANVLMWKVSDPSSTMNDTPVSQPTILTSRMKTPLKTWMITPKLDCYDLDIRHFLHLYWIGVVGDWGICRKQSVHLREMALLEISTIILPFLTGTSTEFIRPIATDDVGARRKRETRRKITKARSITYAMWREQKANKPKLSETGQVLS